MTRADKTFFAVMALVIPFGLAVMLFRAHMEASTYNRLTGQDVTTWEALWVELRLDGNDGP